MLLENRNTQNKTLQKVIALRTCFMKPESLHKSGTAYCKESWSEQQHSKSVQPLNCLSGLATACCETAFSIKEGSARRRVDSAKKACLPTLEEEAWLSIMRLQPQTVGSAKIASTPGLRSPPEKANEWQQGCNDMRVGPAQSSTSDYTLRCTSAGTYSAHSKFTQIAN